MLEFYFYLAIAYNQAERADDALAVCQKALENITEKSKKEVVSDFYAIMGDIYHTKKMNAEAYALMILHWFTIRRISEHE